jgi:hypothetical protein
MTGAYRMSKRMVQTFCADVLGVPVCAGQVGASEAETASAVEPVVQQLREYARSQPANVDETGSASGLAVDRGHPCGDRVHDRAVPRRWRSP